MPEAAQRDIFDRARMWASIVLVVAGLAAIAGALLDWVAIDDVPSAPEGTAAAREIARFSQPFNGVDAGVDGWIAIVAGALVVGCAALLTARRRGSYAALAFAACIVIGAVGISNFRQISQENSDLLREMARIGDVGPGIGVVLVTAAGIVGVLAAAGGMVATPRAAPR